jgi:hypothetical protein
MTDDERSNARVLCQSFSKPIARAVVRDERLSWAARGLFVFLWDLPDGWRLRASHIAKMGPQGRDAINSLLKELQHVGALETKHIRSSDGTFNGKRWLVRDPGLWAKESKLSKAACNTAEVRDIQPSENSNIGEPETKVHQSDGSPIHRDLQDNDHQSLNQCGKLDLTVVVADLDDLVDAAAWAAGKSEHGGYRFRIRERIVSQRGPSPEDLTTLHRWRKHIAAVTAAAEEKIRIIQRDLHDQTAAESRARKAEELFGELPISDRLGLLDQIPHHIRAARRDETMTAIKSGCNFSDLPPSLRAEIRNLLLSGKR